MKIKRIHVNQHNIRYNKKYTNGDFTQTKPVITVKTYKENIKGDTVQINGASTVVYKPEHPLSCGAKVWIETHAEVRVYHMESRPREDNFNKTVLVERIIK
jgi:hypothetical protein